MSSSTFAPFSRLPEELRLRIWETATTAIGPRVIIVEERGRDCSEERFEGNGYRNNNPLTFPTYHTSCASGVPAVLHATRESRAVAMEQYKLSFRTVDGRPKWFNSEIDILYIKDTNWSWWVFCHFATVNELPSIRNLAINNQAWRQRVLPNRLLPFRDLKIIYLQSLPLPSAHWHLNNSQIVKDGWNMLRQREIDRNVSTVDRRGEEPIVVWISQFGFVNFPFLRTRREMSTHIGLVHATQDEKRIVDEAWRVGF